MKKYNVLFMGTPEFARVHLEAVLKNPRLNVVAVVTQPDRPAGRKLQLKKSPVREFAEAHGLKVFVPESIKSQSVLEEIKSLNPEAVIVVAYGQIISKEFLNHFKDKVVNIHASLLPRWRGAAPIQRALMAGDFETGVSLQVMVHELDAGDIIGERHYKISAAATATDLYKELPSLGAELLANEFLSYLDGNIRPKPQNIKDVTLAAKIAKSEALINWQLSAKEVYNLVRGLSEGPYAYTRWQGRDLKVHDCEVTTRTRNNEKCGQVLDVEGAGITVMCGIDALKIKVVQPESKPRMTVQSFLAGHQLAKGEILG